MPNYHTFLKAILAVIGAAAIIIWIKLGKALDIRPALSGRLAFVAPEIPSHGTERCNKLLFEYDRNNVTKSASCMCRQLAEIYSPYPPAYFAHLTRPLFVGSFMRTENSRSVIYASFFMSRIATSQPIPPLKGGLKEWLEVYSWGISPKTGVKYPCQTMTSRHNGFPNKSVIVLRCEVNKTDGVENKRVIASAMTMNKRKLVAGFTLCSDALKPSTSPVHVGACSIVTAYHADRLPEWMEYHLLNGFEYFVIYVNDADFMDYFKFLKYYLEKGVLTLVPFYFHHKTHPFQMQPAQYMDCYHRLRNHATWIAMIDVDEVLFFYNGTVRENVDLIYKENPRIGGVEFQSWWQGRKNPILNGTETVGPFKVANSLRDYPFTNENPEFFNRQKVVMRAENVLDTSIHSINDGGPLYNVDPFTEGRIVHFRSGLGIGGNATIFKLFADRYSTAIDERLSSFKSYLAKNL